MFLDLNTCVVDVWYALCLSVATLGSKPCESECVHDNGLSRVQLIHIPALSPKGRGPGGVVDKVFDEMPQPNEDVGVRVWRHSMKCRELPSWIRIISLQNH